MSKKISELNDITEIASDDLLVAVDTSNVETVKLTVQQLIDDIIKPTISEVVEDGSEVEY